MAGEREKVLVVDDEETVRNLLQRTLEEAGYDVDTAANGEEALDRMSQLNRRGVSGCQNAGYVWHRSIV